MSFYVVSRGVKILSITKTFGEAKDILATILWRDNKDKIALYKDKNDGYVMGITMNDGLTISFEALKSDISVKYLKYSEKSEVWYYITKGTNSCCYFISMINDLSESILSDMKTVEKYQDLVKEIDGLKKRNAFLECEPYRGPEFFEMLNEEKSSGLLVPRT